MIQGNIPIWEKYALTVKEATTYFGIGEKKLRRIIDENLDSGMFIQNGNRFLMKRQAFENYLNDTTSI